MFKSIVSCLFVLCLGVLSGCGDAPITQKDQQQLIPASAIEKKSGTAIMLVIDTSGSMSEKPQEGGEPKIVTARQAAKDVVTKIQNFAAAHPDRQVVIGIMKFSTNTQIVVPVGSPSLQNSTAAIDSLSPESGTAIGDAMFDAKKALDETGFDDRHIIVVTDGENNAGRSPDSVAKTISELGSAGAKMYVIGFDVNAATYAPMKAYANIYSAKDSTQLDSALQFIVGKKILAEQD
jgi:Mg-chelatase subunit ChlD